MWKALQIGVGLVVESALCASGADPDQSEETKRTSPPTVSRCVTSR